MTAAAEASGGRDAGRIQDHLMINNSAHDHIMLLGNTFDYAIDRRMREDIQCGNTVSL